MSTISSHKIFHLENQRVLMVGTRVERRKENKEINRELRRSCTHTVGWRNCYYPLKIFCGKELVQRNRKAGKITKRKFLPLFGSWFLRKRREYFKHDFNISPISLQLITLINFTYLSVFFFNIIFTMSES